MAEALQRQGFIMKSVHAARWEGGMGPTERTATDSGDSELMDSKTKALLDAIGQAEECRRDDPMERICHTCWEKVCDAVRPSRSTRKNTKFCLAEGVGPTKVHRCAWP